MFKAEDMIVLDLTPELGGRVFSFYQAGFRNIYALEKDIDIISRLTKLIDPHNIIQGDVETVCVNDLPKADIIISNFHIHPNPYINQNIQEKNDAFIRIIHENFPAIFLLRCPSILAVRRNNFEILPSDILRNYVISYKVFKESDFSGFPIAGSQLYMIGIRSDLYHSNFEFPVPDLMENKDYFMEDPYHIEEWYRKIPPRINEALSYIEIIPETLYTYIHRTLRETRYISQNGQTFYVDSLGMRYITHREYAIMKGIPFVDEFCNKKHSMYRQIFTSSNVYIVRKFADNIKEYINHCKSDTIEIENPKYSEPIFNKIESIDNTKTQKVKANNIIFPKLNLLNMHIDELKGLKNIDITFEKNLTAIMGVNGAGKSTILHALACVFSPYSDNVKSHKFSFFFTPNPDATWKNSKFMITYSNENNPGKTFSVTYEKAEDRWKPQYVKRPERDVFYVGIDTCIPYIEKETKTTYINYSTNDAVEKHIDKILKAASHILNKDYDKLKYHTTKTKKFIGVHTLSGLDYSSLSMGAGEQRVFKILELIHIVKPYSMILVDEIDLLLHVSALKKMIEYISKIAKERNLQIVFTTHSIVMGELTEFVDIRYLQQLPDKTLVYDNITQDIVYELNKETTKSLRVFVEDDLSKSIISNITKTLGMSRKVEIRQFGSAKNGLTLSAGLVLEGNDIQNTLVVLDGDEYTTYEEKKSQLKKAITGTESYHNEKIDSALSIITQFSLPLNTPPEKHIHDMLITLDIDDEIINCAQSIKSATDSHNWLNDIVKRLGHSREVLLYQIIELVSQHPNWEEYINDIKNWLKQNNIGN